MQIIVHRGIDQIGGCITEVRTARTKIFIDLGRNLPQGNQPVDDKLDDAEAISRLCEGCDAVCYTHYHGDHIDLFRHVPEQVVQYVGPLAKEVMRIKLERMMRYGGRQEQREHELALLERFRTYVPAHKIQIGDIGLTPFLVSHSAADAYMFLIEADGKVVLHTGDFRQHGYLGKGLIPTLNKYILPRGIDVLICEGTMLGRQEQEIVPENALKKQFLEVMKKYRNVLVLCSSTDMDRLATSYQANRMLRVRPFVCDRYQKQILTLFAQTAGVKSDLYGFDQVYDGEVLNAKLRQWMMKEGFTMLIRNSRSCRRMLDLVLPELHPDETVLVYSMFPGYILPSHEAYNPDLDAFVSQFPHREHIHTSGHASPETLAVLCRLTRPRLAIVPIHRDKGSDFAALDIGDTLRSRIVTASCKVEDVDIVVR